MINKVEANADTRRLHLNSHLGPWDEASGSPIWKQPCESGLGGIV